VNESVWGSVCACVFKCACVCVFVGGVGGFGEVGVDGCRWANDMSRDVRLIYLLFPQIEALSNLIY